MRRGIVFSGAALGVYNILPCRVFRRPEPVKVLHLFTIFSAVCATCRPAPVLVGVVPSPSLLARLFWVCRIPLLACQLHPIRVGSLPSPNCNQFAFKAGPAICAPLRDMAPLARFARKIEIEATRLRLCPFYHFTTHPMARSRWAHSAFASEPRPHRRRGASSPACEPH